MKYIALHILDLVQNSARAHATTVKVLVTEDPANNHYLLQIEDNGTGMTEAIVQKATDPFFTTRSTRKIGMGLPLIQMNAEQTGGTFSLWSEPGNGTRLEACFTFNHPDRLPLGEIDDVLVLLSAGLPDLRLIYEHKTPTGFYRFDTDEIREIIGNIQENNLQIRKFLREMIAENLAAINAEP